MSGFCAGGSLAGRLVDRLRRLGIGASLTAGRARSVVGRPSPFLRSPGFDFDADDRHLARRRARAECSRRGASRRPAGPGGGVDVDGRFGGGGRVAAIGVFD